MQASANQHFSQLYPGSNFEILPKLEGFKWDLD